MKQILLYVILLGAFTTSYAQETGTIKGTVIDTTGNPMGMASIIVDGMQKGTLTNKEGKYTIRKVPVGTYTIRMKMIGFKEQQEEVNVKAGQTSEAHFTAIEDAYQMGLVSIHTKGDTSAYYEKQPSYSLRLNQPLIEAPQNIVVVNNQAIEDQQSISMREAVTRNVSGAQMIEHWSNFARINMRGFRIPAFRNGFNVEMTWGPLSEDMSIVELIEFVKGPAGFMLSSGEPGGFYNVVTKKPHADQENEVSLMTGSFSTVRSTADVGGKLTEDGRLRYRLNVMGTMAESHRDFEFNNRYTIAPSLRYKFSERTEITGEYIYQKANMANMGSPYLFAPDDFKELPRNLSLLEPNMEPTNIDEQNVFVALNHHFNENWSFTAQLGYLHYKQIGSTLWPASVDSAGNIARSISTFDVLNESQYAQAFVNGEIETGPIKHSILGGLDIGNKENFYDWSQSGAIAGDTFNIYNPQHGVPTDSLPEFDRSKSIRKRAGTTVSGNQYSSLYLQDQLSFFENKVRLTLAGRYTHSNTWSYGMSTTADNVFSPRAGLSVTIAPQTTVYGLYDQSFLPQTGMDFEGNAFVPVRANDIEGGIKRQWMNGKWETKLTAYQITKDNVVVGDPEHINFSIQLGQVQSRGIEFDLQGEVVKGLDAIFNYALTNVEITEDTDESLIGERVAGHARHMTNGWLKYRFRAQELKGLGLSLGYQYQIDRSSWSWGSDNEAIMPDYFRLDGAISWTQDQLSIGLNVNNILNDYLYSGAAYAAYTYWQAEPGTNFRLNMRYRF